MEKGKIYNLVGIIILILVILSVIGGLASTMVDSGNAVTQANTCSRYTGVNGETLTYNVTTDLCDNSTDNGVVDASADLPLEGLFSPTGVIWLVVMAALLLAVIGISLKVGKK